MTDKEFEKFVENLGDTDRKYAYDVWDSMMASEREACTVENMKGYIEDTYKAVEEQRLRDVPNDKIFVAVLDDSYFEEHDDYPENFDSDFAYKGYVFDTPEEFVEKWFELEGTWYWCFNKGELFCSGAIDPGDIEIFEEYFETNFDNLVTIETVREYMENIKLGDYDLDGVEITEDDYKTILARVKGSDDSLEDVVHKYLIETREVLDAGLDEHDEDIDLPECVTISAAQLALDTDDICEDEYGLGEIVGDYLSDTYGFCHYGFDLDIVYNEFNEPSEFVVSGIKWDVDEQQKSIDGIIANAEERSGEVGCCGSDKDKDNGPEF